MTFSFYPDSLLGRLERHSNEHADQVIFTFLQDHVAPETLTFRQLATRVRTIASKLRETISPCERAVLLYPQGLEFICAFLGCLAAGVIAVPAFPPRKNRKAHRLNAIIADCKPAALLTSSDVTSTFPDDLARLPVLTSDQWETTESPGWDAGAIRPETLAFLQYTSGSTGDPKGVMVSHSNIACNEQQIQKAFGFVPLSKPNPSTMVSWLPLFHDMGLIGNVLQPLYTGCQSVLFTPSSFTQEPIRWLRAISDYRGTISGAPNFAYDLCIRAITEEQKVGLDLSSLCVLYNGAEPVRGESFDRFAAAFAKCGFPRRAFLSCYGLAEATLLVSGTSPNEEEPARLSLDFDTLNNGCVEPAAADDLNAKHLVSCGCPAPGIEIAVWDSAANRTADPGTIGEVWVKGGCVASGYWGRDEQTRATFQNRISNADEGQYLATGDLGFIKDGELFVTGRMKDLIIIRGRNIYPQDVESVVARMLSFVELNSCAAFSHEENGIEHLAVVAEADRALVRKARSLTDGTDIAATVNELAGMVDQVRQAVADEFEVGLYAITFVRPGSFPRTSSGKVQRQACRMGLRDTTLDVVYEWRVSTESTEKTPGDNSSRVEDSASPQGSVSTGIPGRQSPLRILLEKTEPGVARRQVLENQIQQHLAKALQIPASRFEIHKPFEEMGLDSMAAVEIRNRLQAETGLELSATLVWNFSTIAKLATELAARMGVPLETSENGNKVMVDGKSPLETLEQLSDSEVDRLFEMRIAGRSTNE